MKRFALLAAVAAVLLASCDTASPITPSSTPPSSTTPSSTTSTTPTTSTTSTSTTQPAIDASGVFSGVLQVTPIPGSPGTPYTATFTVVIDACGGATLTQEPDQESVGTYQVDPLDPTLLHIELLGEGADYREAYQIEIVIDGEPRVAGVVVGGGHGLGDVPDAAVLRQELIALGLALHQAAGTGSGSVFIEPPEGATVLDDWYYTRALQYPWFGLVEGPVSRTSDAPACD